MKNTYHQGCDSEYDYYERGFVTWSEYLIFSNIFVFCYILLSIRELQVRTKGEAYEVKCLLCSLNEIGYELFAQSSILMWLSNRIEQYRFYNSPCDILYHLR
uniref:Uncharacterized protein n=1 Tax=Rhizophagus irregularis (strain DAOM 181602 / DAOM 197198 / MUCL 43194) TaxID=747089 RepID=U9UNC5_RHIID